MNFLRITAVIDGRYVEAEMHLDTSDLADVVAALNQMVADVNAALKPGDDQ